MSVQNSATVKTVQNYLYICSPLSVAENYGTQPQTCLHCINPIPFEILFLLQREATSQLQFEVSFTSSYRKLVSSWSCSQAVSKPVWHIPLLCVQWKTPDDRQRNCLKHVQFYSKNKFWEISASSWFYYNNLSGCTVTWKSNLSFTTNIRWTPILSNPSVSEWRILRIINWTAWSVTYTPRTPPPPKFSRHTTPEGGMGITPRMPSAIPCQISQSRRLVSPVITTVFTVTFNRTRWNAAQYLPNGPNVTHAEIVQQCRQAAENVVFLSVRVSG
jgi:hypothetical protein